MVNNKHLLVIVAFYELEIIMRTFSLNFILAIFAVMPIFHLKQVYAQTKLFEIKEILNKPSSSIDPGGVIIQINSDLKLEPKMLSYKEGHLHAVIDGKQLKVRVEPKIIQEALEILDKTNRDTFQVSINPTATTINASYIDFPLRDTEIGQAFVQVDTEGLYKLLTRSVELPRKAPSHPDDIVEKLLKTDTNYQSLPIQVGIPSTVLIGSQTYLSFNSSTPGLVDIQFKSFIALLSVRGQYLAVKKPLRTFIDLPFDPLARDIKSRPLEYENVLPSLKKAVAITATMGLINAGCRNSVNCTHLLKQSKIDQPIQSIRQVNSELPSPLSQSFTYPRSYLILKTHWENFSSINWEPGDDDKAWSSAYDALCQILANLGNHETSSKVKDLISKQFRLYPVPNEPKFQAASAVVYAWNGNVNAVEQSLQKAIELSKESPEDRFEAANIGIHVSKIFRDAGDEEKANKTYLRMKHIRDEAQVSTFDKFDKILKSCELKTRSCSWEDLLIWESEAFRAGLFETGHLLVLQSNWFITDSGWEVPGRNLAWLHGRFAYLIGTRLDKIDDKLNRLRYLESYASDPSLSTSQSIHLKILVYRLRASLEYNSGNQKE